MIERSGKVIFGAGARVTGRLWRADGAQRAASDMAKILVWDGMSSICPPSDGTAVGVVVTAGAECVPDGSFGELPVLCLYEDAQTAQELLLDKIAILDCQRGRLCVDPDIDVIKSYFEKVSLNEEDKTPWICTDSTSAAGCDGVMVRVGGGEDDVYEALCDVADKNTGARIIAQTEYGDGMTDRIRGIYRAAVWGRISMLCRARTPKEAEDFFSLTHSAFCALEKQAREFNGFIPRGILIDTPIMILSVPNRFADFFVVDCNSLTERFCAADASSEISRSVFAYVSEYINRSSDAQTSLLCHGETASCAVQYFKAARQLSEIYTDRKTRVCLGSLI